MRFEQYSVKKFLPFLTTTLCLAFPTVSCATSKKYDVDYYKDGTFQNQEKHQSKSFFSYIWMRLKTQQREWPEFVPLKMTSAAPDPQSNPLKVYYVNHSTFLIQYKGMNILTDPVFSERVSPVTWAGPKRVTPVGFTFEQIPKIDVIIISHDHYDHLDLVTLKKFYKRDKPLILLGLGAGRVFEKEKFRELKWWESIDHGSVKITFTPAQHFSGRSLWDRNTTLWGAYVLQFADRTLYFGGDTGYSSHFLKTAEKFGPMDVSFLPIGAYDPRDFMEYHHLDPEQAYQSHLDLKSKFSIGMHWGTFQLTNEAREEPQARLQAVAAKNADSSFIAPENGSCWQETKEGWRPCKQDPAK
jgi:L-ascorbate metabolism protein UlaG (beta-lactamase superfamily)